MNLYNVLSVLFLFLVATGLFVQSRFMKQNVETDGGLLSEILGEAWGIRIAKSLLSEMMIVAFLLILAGGLILVGEVYWCGIAHAEGCTQEIRRSLHKLFEALFVLAFAAVTPFYFQNTDIYNQFFGKTVGKILSKMVSTGAILMGLLITTVAVFLILTEIFWWVSLFVLDLS